MKTKQLAALLLAHLPFAFSLHGQGFDSGSNGSYGSLSVPTGTTTLDLPADGIFHCTTIDIPSGAILSFNRNALNTPVYLLATGDVTIAGQIDLSAANAPNSVSGGVGGPGGFDGGSSGFISAGVTRPAGDGMGPGGGKRGDANTVGGGSFGGSNLFEPATRGHGTTYGNPLLIPLIGGSGGGGQDGVSGGQGGGGGGAILIASNTRINFTGTIRSQSASGTQASTGSSGAVRLVAPQVFGNGTINVGGWWSPTSGHGRIRIDSLFKVDPADSSQFLAINYSPPAAATVGANMIVFPPDNPRLDIVQAAGTNLAEGGPPAVIVLPIDASTAQTVRVQARNFNASVPIRVALIPESGDSTYFDGTIDNEATNPATATVNVTMPTNVKVNVQVWTRTL